MVRCRKQPFGWVFISRMIVIICLLIVIVAANILALSVTNPVFKDGVAFLNANFWLLMLIAVIILVGDLFTALPFPLNLPGPIIKAVGSVFGFAFLLRIFQWVDGVTSTNIYLAFLPLSFLIIPLVFLIVLVCGYYEILRQLWWVPRAEPVTGDGQIVHQAPVIPDIPPGSITDAKSWEDIGAEFRLMLYDLIHRFREEIRKE
ncbi:MAG: hypothetical protein GYA23_13635 [Methanomicrobiales archaeon]|nr:hypothetical protein [Methanomicrobiales archaeon]